MENTWLAGRIRDDASMTGRENEDVRIDRPRLAAVLDATAHGPLTVITAPAGSGKTVLLDQWCASRCGDVSILVDADGSTVDEIVDAVTAQLGLSGQTTLRAVVDDPETLLSLLVDQLAAHVARTGPVWVVFDAGRSGLTSDLDLVLDRLVSATVVGLHVIVATRWIPETCTVFTEDGFDHAAIGEEQLAFDEKELVAIAFKIIGRRLTPEECDTLVDRTEGWVTGVVAALVAVHGDGSDDRVSVDRATSRLDSYFETAILSDLDAGAEALLCDVAHIGLVDPSMSDALCGRSDSREALNDLERRLPFVRRVDPHLDVYELFPLLAESLRRRSATRDPERHAQISRDIAAYDRTRNVDLDVAASMIAERRWGRAVELLARAGRTPMSDIDFRRARDFTQAIPQSILRAHPIGLHALVTHTINVGDAEGARDLLRLLEAQIGANPATEMRDRVFVHGAKSALGRWDDDAQATVDEATAGLALLERLEADLPDGADIAPMHWARTLLFLYGGGGLARQGRIADARTWLALAEQSAIDQPVLRARSVASQGLVHAVLGSFDEALDDAARSEALAEDDDGPSPVRIEVYQTRALVAIERDELTAARSALDLARRVTRDRVVPEHRALSAFVQARLALAAGDVRGGLVTCRRWHTNAPHVGVGNVGLELHATWIRLEVRANHLDRARWLVDRLPEGEALRGARALAAFVRDDVRTLSVLIDSWPASEMVGRQIEFHIFGALRADRLGRDGDARGHLIAAAQRSEPQRFHRVFLDTAPGVVDLVTRLARCHPDPWLARLAWRLDRGASPLSERNRPTNRELEILGLLATSMSSDEIADRLGIALSTLKTHSTRLYRKLGVSRRPAAIERAVDLGLLAPSSVV